MFRCSFLIVLALTAVSGAAQPAAHVTQIAGVPWVQPPFPLPGVDAPLHLDTTTIGAGPDGSVYIGYNYNSQILKLDTAGQLSVFAGNGDTSISTCSGPVGDGGFATNAPLTVVGGIQVGSDNTVYFTDCAGLREITSDGIINTFSKPPSGVLGAVDGNGALYFVNGNAVHRRNPDTSVTTIQAPIPCELCVPGPSVVGVDSNGTVYLVFVDNSSPSLRTVIESVDSQGVATVLPDYPTVYGRIVSSADGTVYLIAADGSQIDRLNADYSVNRVAGTGSRGYSGDNGSGGAADIQLPEFTVAAGIAQSPGVAANSLGEVDFVDGNVVRRVSSDGKLHRIIGNFQYQMGGDGGPSVAASLVTGVTLSADPAGDLLISAPDRIRQITPDGSIATFGGFGIPLTPGASGPAITGYGSINNAVADSAGNTYIADGLKNRIVKLDSLRRATLYAGNGAAGNTGEGGPAVNAAIDSPAEMTADAIGDLFFWSTDRIRRIDSGGVISTVPTDSLVSCCSSQMTPSFSADGLGNLFVGDSSVDGPGFTTIVRITRAGNASLYAGGGSGSLVDGAAATTASIAFDSLAADTSGSVYFEDTGTNQVWRIDPNGVLHQIPADAEMQGTLAASDNDLFGIVSDYETRTGATLWRLHTGLTIAPTALSFQTLSCGSATAQNVSVVSFNRSLTFTASSDQAWLSASPARGKTVPAASLAVSVDPSSLATGSYSGNITLSSSSGETETLGVNVSVTPGNNNSLVAGSSTLAFAAIQGASQIPPQVVAVTPRCDPVRLTASADQPWLTATVAKDNSGVIVTVTNQAVGTYSGNVQIGGAGVASSLVIPVTLTVVAPNQFAHIASVVNSASFLGGPLAGGTLFTVFGGSMSGATTTASSVPLPPALGDVTLLVNGIPAPLLYESPSQINAQMPYEVTLGDAELTLEINGEKVATAPLQIAPVSPGLFRQQGTFHAAALNEDYSVNSASNPARPGHAIMVYLTGQGALDHSIADGAPAGASPLSLTQAPTSAAIAGESATVLFSGMAPGLVGVAQVNILLPSFPPTLPQGDYPLNLTVGGAPANVGYVSIAPVIGYSSKSR